MENRGIRIGMDEMKVSDGKRRAMIPLNVRECGVKRGIGKEWE